MNLTGPAKTMLSTLYLKALDADFPRPVLADRYAKAVARIDYDWESLDIGGAPGAAVHRAHRAVRHLDATVPGTAPALHGGAPRLRAGRPVFRIEPGAGVEWYDVDFPEVIALREQVPDPAELPPHRELGDRPVLARPDPGGSPGVVPGRGHQHVSHRRRGGSRCCAGWWTAFRPARSRSTSSTGWRSKSQKTQTLVRRSGSTLYWAVNSPEDVLRRVPGLRLREWSTFFGASTFARVTAWFRAAKRAARLAPAVRKAAQYHVYEFGSPYDDQAATQPPR